VRRFVAFVVVAVLLAAACGDDDGADGATTSGGSATISEGELDWIECPDAGDDVECATLAVPRDYDEPDGETIDLALMRDRAGDDDARIGSLLVNPGGPGVPGTDLVPAAAFIWPAEIRDRFDIVGWDPRGTGGSAPVDCVDDVDRYFAEPDPSPDDDAENQVLVDRAQEFDNACEEAAGDLLGQISTVDTANDLERIRIALGENTISYMGFSYGSELGATYATLFPRSIRAMVLDGAIDPDLDSIETARAQAIGAEHALDAFLADCSSHSTCAFHNDGDAEGAYDTLIAGLDADPLPPPESGRPEVGQGVALNAVIQALYSTDFWPVLAEALDAAQDGDGDGLLALSDTYLERDDDGTWTNTIEAFISISCLDDPAPRDLDAYAELADEFEQVAPRLGRSFASGYQCALWPVESEPGPSVDGAGAPPIIVAGTTGDPYTPLEQTAALADALATGVLLVREGEGHTGYGEGSCIDDLIDDYLIDLTVPEDGTRC
jgi:pimeloyl-ACP methyl ester carboxylesterase